MDHRFYVGQRVVCVDVSNPHPHMGNLPEQLKKGQEYIIQGIKQGCCTINVDVGIYTGLGTGCGVCNIKISGPSENAWFKASRFVPVEEQKSEFKEVTYTKIMETIPSLSEN